MKWTKKGDAFRASEGPFIANVAPKGDGRWNWEVFADAQDNPTATGVRSSLGGAKSAAELFIQRSGRV
ncbi:MAG TPA: hypothetical protein VM925_18810 [Labilithrix sp.]|jgi:hypothetical protein|nr:hypothetical protein [Labilithrix sp.]